MGAPGPVRGPLVAIRPKKLADAGYPPTVSAPHASAHSVNPGRPAAASPIGRTDDPFTPTGTSYSHTAAPLRAHADLSVRKVGGATGGRAQGHGASSRITDSRVTDRFGSGAGRFRPTGSGE